MGRARLYLALAESTGDGQLRVGAQEVGRGSSVAGTESGSQLAAVDAERVPAAVEAAAAVGSGPGVAAAVVVVGEQRLGEH